MRIWGTSFGAGRQMKSGWWWSYGIAWIRWCAWGAFLSLHIFISGSADKFKGGVIWKSSEPWAVHSYGLPSFNCYLEIEPLIISFQQNKMDQSAFSARLEQSLGLKRKLVRTVIRLPNCVQKEPIFSWFQLHPFVACCDVLRCISQLFQHLFVSPIRVE